MLNFAFQADVNNEVGSNFYDLDNYEVEDHDNFPPIPDSQGKERYNFTFKPKNINKVISEEVEDLDETDQFAHLTIAQKKQLMAQQEKVLCTDMKNSIDIMRGINPDMD
jgi:hypothetical protein